LELINSFWSATTQFFDLPIEKKSEVLSQDQNKYPFGYFKFGGEILSAGKDAEKDITQNSNRVKLPDLKEMFSLGPQHPQSGFPSRIFPTESVVFAELYTKYYEEVNNLAKHILRSFAIALNLENELFFEKFIDHHASAIRSLNYPSITNSKLLHPNQLRASAHTDYGTITILRSDGPGLQVTKDKDPPNWIDVPFVENSFVINLGFSSLLLLLFYVIIKISLFKSIIFF
jgi:isopenicillin N synthase-like dioxygenase